MLVSLFAGTAPAGDLNKILETAVHHKIPFIKFSMSVAGHDKFSIRIGVDSPDNYRAFVMAAWGLSAQEFNLLYGDIVKPFKSKIK